MKRASEVEIVLLGKIVLLSDLMFLFWPPLDVW